MRYVVRDERGTSLILAIVFMVVVGMISAAVLPAITSSLRVRTTLDNIRDRQYAADGAIEHAIAQIRNPTPTPPPTYRGPALSPCGPSVTNAPYYYTVTEDGASIHVRVDCAGEPTLTLGTSGPFLQQNVLFSACVVATPDVACGGATTPIVIRAQVNFQAVGAGSRLVIQRTWIQSWSVNG